MANQYPPTRDQYVASIRRQAANLGGALGMVAAIGLMAASGVQLTLLSAMLSPMALFVGAGMGMLAMGALGSVYAATSYRRRYAKEFSHARELASILAEDPLMTPASPRLLEHTLAEDAAVSPPAQNRWSDRLVPADGFADRLLEEEVSRELQEHALSR